MGYSHAGLDGKQDNVSEGGAGFRSSPEDPPQQEARRAASQQPWQSCSWSDLAGVLRLGRTPSWGAGAG